MQREVVVLVVVVGVVVVEVVVLCGHARSESEIASYYTIYV